MVDLFEEVDERLRSEHYLALARRYLPWIIGVLLVALAVALTVSEAVFQSSQMS